MRNSKFTGVFASLSVIVSLSRGSGGTNQNSPAPQRTASVFVVGTDAPLPSVVSCDITATGVTLFDGQNKIPVMT